MEGSTVRLMTWREHNPPPKYALRVGGAISARVARGKAVQVDPGLKAPGFKVDC